jgi:predicted amidohydrolase
MAGNPRVCRDVTLPEPVRARICVAFLLLLTGTLFPFASGQAAANEPAIAKPRSVKVAAIQCSSDLGAAEANRAKLTGLVEKAAAAGAKIIVLPEASITGYLSQDLRTNWHVDGLPIEAAFTGKDPAPFAEEVPGPSTRHFCELAKRLGVYITVPFVEVPHRPATRDKDRGAQASADALTYFNTVCLVSPQGQVAAHYRKLAPWPYPEKSWATAGDRGVQIVDTEYGRVGLAICWDIHTILEKYQRYKIWALLYSIAWVDDSHPADWFWHRLPRRVAQFKHYVIGANWSVDQKQAWYGYGFSKVISPEGDIVACSHKLYGSDIVYATIRTAWAGKE